MQDRSGCVISVAHTKGGAGKTSLTINLGYTLGETGARVLVIDLDAQCGQSTFLRQPFDGGDSGNVLLGRCAPDDAIVADVYPNMDVMPADEWAMSEAWRLLHTDAGRPALAGLLDHGRRNWDVVLVDTPGHQSAGLAMTLGLSDGVIIPTPPEAGPVGELPTILNAITVSSEEYGRPEVYGIVRTRVWGNSVYRRVAEDQIRAIADEYGVPLFRHKVPEDAKFGEAHLIGMPVAAYQPRARAAVAYRYVAYELIMRRGWPFTVEATDVVEPE